MPRQCRCTIIHLTAFRAHVVPIAGVRFHMYFQIVTLTETFLANRAGKWSFRLMRQHVRVVRVVVHISLKVIFILLRYISK